MNDELMQKNITISKIEQNQYGYKISDEKGLIYNVSATKSDNKTPTVAYQNLTSLPNNGMGLKKCFKFVTVQNSQGGESRYVRIIAEPELEQFQGNEPTYQPENALEGQNKPLRTNYSPIKEEEKPNWDDINFGKCKHQFLIEAFKYLNSQNIDPNSQAEHAEQRAEKWAEMSMRKLPKQFNQLTDQKLQDVANTTVRVPRDPMEEAVNDMPIY